MGDEHAQPPYPQGTAACTICTAAHVAAVLHCQPWLSRQALILESGLRSTSAFSVAWQRW